MEWGFWEGLIYYMDGDGRLTGSDPHLVTLEVAHSRESNVFVHDEAVDFVEQKRGHEGQSKPEKIGWMLG